jgi:hypothetical protein
MAWKYAKSTNDGKKIRNAILAILQKTSYLCIAFLFFSPFLSDSSGKDFISNSFFAFFLLFGIIPLIELNVKKEADNFQAFFSFFLALTGLVGDFIDLLVFDLWLIPFFLVSALSLSYFLIKKQPKPRNIHFLDKINA